MNTIVTTTINKPTKATIKFCQKKNWNFIVVGDLKTPHHQYKDLEKKYSNLTYLSPEDQEKKYRKLSNAIGWNSIQRRNIGFVEAYKRGAEIIASVDDDNIPYDSWGDKLTVGEKIEIDIYESVNGVFDPLSVTEHNYVWHRGYPIELISERTNVHYRGKQIRKVMVQADLWDGDPDIDAIARLTMKPNVKFSSSINPFSSVNISPFNSQNTFFSREVVPYYSVIPFVGRMDDIWGGYIMQYYFPSSVVYGKPSVYQDRNKQDLIVNLENEMIGYRNTLKLIENLKNYKSFLPKESLDFLKIYKKEML